MDTDRTNTEQASTEQASTEQASTEQASTEQTSTEQTSTEQTSTEQTSTDRTKTTRRTGDRPRATPRLDQLAEKLSAATGPACSHRIEVPMTAAATAVILLGTPPELAGAFLTSLAARDPDETAEHVRQLWKETTAAHAHLDGHLDALIGWLTERTPSSEDLEALRRCLGLLGDHDLHAIATQPGVDGEILGPLYTLLRSPGTRRATGAFYTPMSVATLLAQLTGLDEGQSFVDPCAGAGALAVAAAREMRTRGQDPARVRWLLNDIDPIAVALSGINAVAHGFGHHVTLRCGNGLDPY